MLSAGKINELKSEVKALMLKRTGYGSIQTYGGAEYDFSSIPAKDTVIKTEHGIKTVNLILQINDYPGLSAVTTAGTPIPSRLDEDLLSYVKSLRAKELSDTNNDCKAYCTGLCTSQCSGSCTDQCTSSCGGNCTGTCTGQSYVAPYSDFSNYSDYSNDYTQYSDTYSNAGTFSSYADNPIFSNLYSQGFGSYANNSLFSNAHHN